MEFLTMSVVSNSSGKSGFILRDYAHAAHTFLTEPGYIMAPKYGFLFHIVITFNEQANNTLDIEKRIISALAKKVDLPKFTVDVTSLNKYNWREKVQSKITYDPVNIVFHDDAKNVIRNFWIAYNSYYYADPHNRNIVDWEDTLPIELSDRKKRFGLDNSQTKRFIKTIDIYSMGNQTYTLYKLVNPIISKFNFDTHDYAEGGKIMESNITVEYESVIYEQGSTKEIPQFGSDTPYYDNDPSRLSQARINPRGVVLPSRTPELLLDKQENIPQNNFQATEQARITPVNLQIQNPSNQVTKITPVPGRSPSNPTVPSYSIQDKILEFDAIKTQTVNALYTSQPFTFPTAKEFDPVIKNNYASSGRLVSSNINPESKEINRIPLSSSVVASNGAFISSVPKSSNGLFGSSANNSSELLITPNVPENLTESERLLFLKSFPPLPSTDTRVRMAPYV